VPILFLIGYDNPAACYFLQVILIFIVSMSMVLILFAPAFVNYNKQNRNMRQRATATGVQASLVFDLATQVQGSNHLKTPEHKPQASMSMVSQTGNIPVETMDSIDKKTESTFEESYVNPLSGSAENWDLKSGAQRSKKMIENQILNLPVKGLMMSLNASLECFDFVAIKMVFGGHVLWLTSVPRVTDGHLSCRDLAHEAIRLYGIL
jgi:hypothetical protein